MVPKPAVVLHSVPSSGDKWKRHYLKRKKKPVHSLCDRDSSLQVVKTQVQYQDDSFELFHGDGRVGSAAERSLSESDHMRSWLLWSWLFTVASSRVCILHLATEEQERTFEQHLGSGWKRQLCKLKVHFVTCTRAHADRGVMLLWSHYIMRNNLAPRTDIIEPSQDSHDTVWYMCVSVIQCPPPPHTHIHTPFSFPLFPSSRAHPVGRP